MTVEYYPDSSELFTDVARAIGGVNDFVDAFRGAANQRRHTKEAFLGGVIDEPVLNDRTRLGQEHVDRIRAFGEVAAIGSITEALIQDAVSTGTAPDESTLMLVAHIGVQKNLLAFIHGAEALNPASSRRAIFNGREAVGGADADRLADFMKLWASGFGDSHCAHEVASNGEVIWRPAEPEIAKPLLRDHLHYAIQARKAMVDDPRVAYVDAFVGMATSVGEQPTPVMPSVEELAPLHQLVEIRYGATIDHMFDGELAGKSYVPEEAAVLFERALEQRGLAEKGWRVVVDLTHDNMSVDATGKIVYVGKRKSPFQRQDIERLTIHEIGVHAERAQTAEDLGLPAVARTGLPGYLAAEEGLANLLEFAWRGAVVNKLHRYRYLAGAIAQGAVDGQQRTLGQSFPFMAGYALAEMARLGKEFSSTTIDDELGTAYLQSVRSHRGLPSVPGLIDGSSLSYYDGALRVWRECFSGKASAPYLQAGRFDELFIAKYDPTDSR